MATVSVKLLMLATMFLLVGCQSIQRTPTAGIDKKLVQQTCTVWLPITYSGFDTAETQLNVRANNAARDAYCGS